MGGAVAWPALSASTRSTTKSSSDSSKPIPDGSTTASEGPIALQLSKNKLYYYKLIQMQITQCRLDKDQWSIVAATAAVLVVARRDQDPKDVHLSPQFVPPPGGFIPPQSPGSAPFIPAPLRPLLVQWDMICHLNSYVPTLPPESIRGVLFILDCLRASILVEVQEDKGSQTPGGSAETVLTKGCSMSLWTNQAITKANDVDPKDVQVEVAVGGLSEELTSQSKMIQEGNAEEICASHARSSQVC
ncbi:hypothetical protein HAX54_009884 [Datura stramonium]|uniref:Uncharacterized protein n=1 Tax=Datura stramonium TaxID=4076 RepID=A0ABS8TFF4_DATST|nr:hypothetical protein [Datura stramonium]